MILNIKDWLIMEVEMRTVNLIKFSWLSVLLIMSLVIACGDESNDDSPDFLVLGDAPASTEMVTEDGAEVAVQDEVEPEIEPEVEPEIDRGTAELFGAPLSDDVQFVAFDELLSDPDPFAGQVIQTEGAVRNVCQRRGCWMEVRSEDDPSSENVNVRFLDYGFFVPLDCRGAFVRIEGIPAVRNLSAEEVEELLAEGYDPGIVREDGTATVVSFTASGVMMWNRLDD
jgi:hypothetical protein